MRQLRHIVALAEHRHFGHAADAVGITQAALTQSIQKAEATCGVALFERRYGDVTPTAYGELVIETARTTLLGVTNMHRQLRLMRKLATGRLIIGCDPYFAEPVVTPPLIRLLNQHPTLEFTLELGGWEIMQEKLISREIDVYLGFPHEPTDSRIAIEEHMLSPVIVFCRPGHGLAIAGDTAKGSVPLSIVVPKASRWLRQKLEAFYSLSEEKLRRSEAAVARLSVDNRLPESSVRSSSIAMRWPRPYRVLSSQSSRQVPLLRVSVEGLDFEVPLVLASAARRSLPPAAHALLAEIRAEIASFVGKNRDFSAEYLYSCEFTGYRHLPS